MGVMVLAIYDKPKVFGPHSIVISDFDHFAVSVICGCCISGDGTHPDENYSEYDWSGFLSLFLDDLN